VARRLDGSPYRPDDDQRGLLAAGSPALWRAVRAQLFDGDGDGGGSVGTGALGGR
jgi:hypothetical protein